MSPTRRYFLNGQPVNPLTVRDTLGPVQLDGVLNALLGHRLNEARCPHCGTSEADIEGSGLVGCPLCYAVHEAYLVSRFGNAANG